MRRISSLVILLLSSLLNGCAMFEPIKGKPGNRAMKSYPGLNTFEYEGAVIYYRDLSDPCDERTVAWHGLSDVDRVMPVTFDAQETDCDRRKGAINAVASTPVEQISIPFASRKTDLENSASGKALKQIESLVGKNNEYQIYGAAGTAGARSEALGLARASAVRDHLVSLGISLDRISIMPYDPDIPGLQAVVKVFEPAVL